jgi:hypothetical protein
MDVFGLWGKQKEKQKLPKAEHLRVGQFLFNAIYDFSPKMANLVRNTSNDPYYADSIKDVRFGNCLRFLHENWHRT